MYYGISNRKLFIENIELYKALKFTSCPSTSIWLNIYDHLQWFRYKLLKQLVKYALLMDNLFKVHTIY